MKHRDHLNPGRRAPGRTRSTETGRTTLDWYKSLPAEIQPRIAPQFAKAADGEAWLDTEKHLLEIWRKREKKNA